MKEATLVEMPRFLEPGEVFAERGPLDVVLEVDLRLRAGAASCRR
jgi:hypothetical protein